MNKKKLQYQSRRAKLKANIMLDRTLHSTSSSGPSNKEQEALVQGDTKLLPPPYSKLKKTTIFHSKGRRTTTAPHRSELIDDATSICSCKEIFDDCYDDVDESNSAPTWSIRDFCTKLNKENHEQKKCAKEQMAESRYASYSEDDDDDDEAVLLLPLPVQTFLRKVQQCQLNNVTPQKGLLMDCIFHHFKKGGGGDGDGNNRSMTAKLFFEALEEYITKEQQVIDNHLLSSSPPIDGDGQHNKSAVDRPMTDAQRMSSKIRLREALVTVALVRNVHTRRTRMYHQLETSRMMMEQEKGNSSNDSSADHGNSNDKQTTSTNKKKQQRSSHASWHNGTESLQERIRSLQTTIQMLDDMQTNILCRSFRSLGCL